MPETLPRIRPTLDVPPGTGPSMVRRAGRLPFIDAVRGLAIVLMALDHVRSFFHAQAALYEPTDLHHATTAIFLTRWITHLCAPLFVLLAGAGTGLSMARGRSPEDMARHLRVRGAWLVAVELTLVKFGWTFNFSYAAFSAQVIWAIGWSMILLSFLVRRNPGTVLKIGVGAIVFYGLFSQVSAVKWGTLSPLWGIFISGHPFTIGEAMTVSPKYPLVPWAALMAVGCGLGPIFLEDRSRRRTALAWSGTILFGLFLCLRWIETGGWRPFAPGASLAKDVLLLIDTRKYPPSLTFLLMTLAPSLWILAAWDHPGFNPDGVLATFGRVPFFFYVVHIPVIHAMAIFAEHYDRIANAPLPADTWRYGLISVYALWFSVLAFLYPACRWFAELKRRRADAWLSFL